MVEIARIDVGTGIQQQVDDRSRACEVQWRLPITTALGHALRVDRQHGGEQIGSVQMRCRTGIGYGTGGEQAFRSRSRRHVQGVKRTRPPFTARIRIGTEFEQHLDHRRIVRTRHDGRRIEWEEGRVDERPELGVRRQQPSDGPCVALLHRVVQLIVRRTLDSEALFDVPLERGPVGEPVLARQHELGVGQHDARLVGEHCAHAGARLWLVAGNRAQQFFCLGFLLREIGARWERTGKRCCHGTPPSLWPASAPSARRGRME